LITVCIYQLFTIDIDKYIMYNSSSIVGFNNDRNTLNNRRCTQHVPTSF